MASFSGFFSVLLVAAGGAVGFGQTHWHAASYGGITNRSSRPAFRGFATPCRRLNSSVMPAGQAASLFWYFQVSGTLESDSPQHVPCSHIGNNKRSGPIRVGRLHPAGHVGSPAKRRLNTLRSLPAPMIQVAAPRQFYSGGFAQRGFLIIAGGRRSGGWLRSNSLARCELRRHNQSFQPTCIPWLRHSMQSAELKRWAP